MEKGIEIGVAKGLVLGMEKGKLEVNRRLMTKGMTSAEEAAAEVSGVSAAILIGKV